MFHSWHNEGKYAPNFSEPGKPFDAARILAMSCYPVIEQHQRLDEGPPEFTISVAYQSPRIKEYELGKPSTLSGWHWTLRWVDSGGKQQHRTGYGFVNAEAAKFEAEELATTIAKRQLGEQVYKFRPEL